MPTTLIVLAHPEVQSFNSQWAARTASAASSLGHEVLWSDLYRMNFDPAEHAGHYAHHDGPFDPLKAQQQAAARGALDPMIASEVEKIRKADHIIFHFPVWWFAVPAMLKGWFDRALVHGAIHDVENRFDNGLCRGKRALFCVTTGSSATESGPGGKEGDIAMLLWPTAYTLRYCGFDVCEPVIVHGVHGYHHGDRKAALERRLQVALESHGNLIAGLGERQLIPFNADSDFDADGRLKPGASHYNDFIKN